MSPEEYTKLQNTPGLKQYFELGDALTKRERAQVRKVQLERRNDKRVRVYAVRTFEKRPPKAGEWYLSGALIRAYRAPNDLTQEFHLCKIVIVREEVVTKIAELEDLKDE